MGGQVKEAMLDSANDSISSLKASLSKAREEARIAENELCLREGHDADRTKNLR